MATKIIVHRADGILTIQGKQQTFKPKKPSGPKKLDFTPFLNECLRRMTNNEAKPTVEAEAADLADWGQSQGIKKNNGGFLQKPRIRDLLKEVFGGTNGYKETLKQHKSS